MLYLTGSLPANPRLFRALEESNHVGALLTPRNHYPSKPIRSWPRAADNGCFGKDWDDDEWRTWITAQSDVLFATVPDVVGDWRATRQRWDTYRADVAHLPAAYVLQDGQPASDVPWDELDAVFIGGSTDYKLSAACRTICDEAQRRGRWVHMGRVNSLTRMRIAADWGCDSVDGNFLAFGPDQNVPRLLGWLRVIHNEQHQLRWVV